MGTRLQLQTILENILGTRNVYFQPPETLKMNYPCIRYELSSVDTEFANDYAYKHKNMYKITIIDSNPDSTIPNSIAKLQMCRFDRRYSSNNLNHTVYTIYY